MFLKKSNSIAEATMLVIYVFIYIECYIANNQPELCIVLCVFFFSFFFVILYFYFIFMILHSLRHFCSLVCSCSFSVTHIREFFLTAFNTWFVAPSLLHSLSNTLILLQLGDFFYFFFIFS